MALPQTKCSKCGQGADVFNKVWECEACVTKESLCECGCGGETNIVQSNHTARGLIKGTYRRFVQGHALKGRRGIAAAQYKGGRLLRDGYVFILVQPDHPYFCMARKFGYSFYIREHRLVMAEYLHRPLRDDEIVHHRNEIRNDNRLENLALFQDTGAHTKFHGGSWQKRRNNV